MSWPVHSLGTVGSTNDEARLRLETGEAAPFWVTAERQVRGRGRLARQWVSEPGNLYASLALRDPAPTEQLPTLSLAIAVGLRRAILAVGVAPSKVRLKWPNDLMLDDRKVGGLLLEAFDGGRSVVVGCGVNCAHYPQITRYGAIALNQIGLEIAPRTLFAAVSDHVAAVLEDWDEGSGFLPLRDEWLECAYGLGRTSSVVQAQGEVTGIPRTIDRVGRLVMETADGNTLISAGDLVPGTAGPGREGVNVHG